MICKICECYRDTIKYIIFQGNASHLSIFYYVEYAS